MKIGCHAVLFTNRILTETENILSGLKSTGCEGVEIGSRFFGLDKREYLLETLNSQGLYLAGLHVSVQWLDLLNKPEAAEESILKGAEFLQVMPYKNIILTGMIGAGPSIAGEAERDPALRDPQTVEKMAKSLNEMAKKAADRGVSVNYHNHCWEFENDGLLFHSLMEYAPQVNFALDTGWAAVSGYDPVGLIEAAPDRFHYVHLRDFKKEIMEGNKTFAQKQEGYVDLGTGDMDYRKLTDVLKKAMGPDDWAVIEYEKGEVSFERYQRAVDYLKEL